MLDVLASPIAGEGRNSVYYTFKAGNSRADVPSFWHCVPTKPAEAVFALGILEGSSSMMKS
jgi:hypothetical protein